MNVRLSRDEVRVRMTATEAHVFCKERAISETLCIADSSMSLGLELVEQDNPLSISTVAAGLLVRVDCSAFEKMLSDQSQQAEGLATSISEGLNLIVQIDIDRRRSA